MNNGNIFSKLKSDGLEEAKDSLGGGFGAIPSDVYTGKIKAAYAGESAGGALSMTFVVGVQVAGKEREYRETVYVTSSKEKGQNNFYERDGKQIPLPGFTTANDICLLTTGYELNAQDFEERIVKIYDFTTRAEVPTKVQMAINVVGQEITLGILQQREAKTKKNEATGQYEDVPGETRDINVIDKVFHTESGRTVSEVSRKLDKGEFLDQWREKNQGQIRDKTQGKAGKPGAPGQGAAAQQAGAAGSKPAGKSLFG